MKMESTGQLIRRANEAVAEQSNLAAERHRLKLEIREILHGHNATANRTIGSVSKAKVVRHNNRVGNDRITLHRNRQVMRALLKS